MLEQWTKVEGIEYEISTHGRIRTIKTGHVSNGCKIKRYLALRLPSHPVYYIHRLVAKYYISNPDNKPEVNHKDGNPHNNHFSNLEWCTRSENVKHAHNLLRFKNKFKLEDEKTISKLHFVYGLTYKQVSEVFNCQWGSIRKVVDRFRDRPDVWANL